MVEIIARSLTGLGNVTYVADTVTWTATAKADDVPNVDIDVFEMQITLGCVFNDPVMSCESFLKNSLAYTRRLQTHCGWTTMQCGSTPTS
jgi:hypothetical protein